MSAPSSSSAAPLSGEPADAPRSGPSSPTAPEDGSSPEAPGRHSSPHPDHSSDSEMENPSFRFTPSQELVLKATMQAVKVAADGPPASGAQGPPVRAKKWEEVEAEARARVVSEGGDPGAEMVVLSRCTVQFGKYRGQTFKWMMENDVGYMMHLVTVHQKERERARSVSQHPLMANKDALTRAPIRPSLRWSGSTGHTRKLKSCPPSQARRARPLSALGSTSGTRCRTCMRLRVQTG
ncbi:uncharacterized protein [Oncorhynchus clarkii lewisi]|uniref:uncharacterized protein n=1 Tax=Oncorhynchus clarkii lewisi TaxID=490388 RepID=UPI0039B86E4D